MKKLIGRLMVSAIFFASAIMINDSQIELVLYAISYVIAGGYVVKRLYTILKRGKFLMKTF